MSRMSSLGAMLVPWSLASLKIRSVGCSWRPSWCFGAHILSEQDKPPSLQLLQGELTSTNTHYHYYKMQSGVTLWCRFRHVTHLSFPFRPTSLFPWTMPFRLAARLLVRIVILEDDHLLIFKGSLLLPEVSLTAASALSGPMCGR